MRTPFFIHSLPPLFDSRLSVSKITEAVIHDAFLDEQKLLYNPTGMTWQASDWKSALRILFNTLVCLDPVRLM
jgi:hypothetical protein